MGKHEASRDIESKNYEFKSFTFPKKAQLNRENDANKVKKKC
jgi:hypothetical protein